MFTHYLKKQAHKDIRKHFETLLYRKGYSDIASKLHKSAHQKTLRGTVAVVDDSRMILNVYKTVLYKLGYESELFEFPSSALESVTEKKPDLLITDLNMPEITGIELVQKIRKKYNSSELPIIMVTTQNETQDNEVAKEAGVNLIMQKPFDENTLGEAIKKVSAT
jgi:CheY-like chemotaxis protein